MDPKLVSHSCHYKISQTVWLKPQTFVAKSHSFGGQSLKSHVGEGGAPSEGSRAAPSCLSQILVWSRVLLGALWLAGASLQSPPWSSNCMPSSMCTFPSSSKDTYHWI